MRTPPYLPFLDGPARVAPQLKPISPESWLQPDTEASDWLPAKRTLMRSRPQDVIFLSQWAAPDVSAICAMISDHLGRVSPDPNYPPREAFEQIASEVSDDLCIMVEFIIWKGLSSVRRPSGSSQTRQASHLADFIRRFRAATLNSPAGFPVSFQGCRRGLFSNVSTGRFSWMENASRLTQPR